MTDWLEQSLIDLGMSVVGWSTKYDCLTMQKRCITGGKQKYRKVFYAWCETRKDTTDTYKLKSKSDSKGQATDEARLLFNKRFGHVEKEPSSKTPFFNSFPTCSQE